MVYVRTKAQVTSDKSEIIAICLGSQIYRNYGSGEFSNAKNVNRTRALIFAYVLEDGL